MSIQNKIVALIRTPYSLYHLQAASLFARLSGRIERDYKNEIPEEIHAEHRSYVTGSILLSVAFLEATINELFADTVDSPTRFDGRLEPNTIKLMASVWQVEEFKRHARILDKFQIALKLASKPLFNEGWASYQDVPLLIRLRNALVHYEPEWIVLRTDPPEVRPEHDFEKMLKGKFPLNPLAAKGSLFYPHKCLSHGCAAWAVITSEKFTSDFHTRMKIIPIYERSISTLTTK